MMRSVCFVLAFLASVQAFAPIAVTRQTSPTTTSLDAVSRQEFFSTLVAAGLASAAMPAFAAEEKTLDNGVKVVINKSGDGPKPDIGELAAIRFRAFFGSTKIDDIFDTPEPYYTRIGNGGMLKVRLEPTKDGAVL